MYNNHVFVKRYISPTIPFNTDHSQNVYGFKSFSLIRRIYKEI